MLTMRRELKLKLEMMMTKDEKLIQKQKMMLQMKEEEES
jgi:hypothetical protein